MGPNDWKSYFVDRQVNAALVELFSDGEPSTGLVALLEPALSKLSRDDIRASLVRARATFDFPSTAGGCAAPQPVAAPAPSAMPGAHPVHSGQPDPSPATAIRATGSATGRPRSSHEGRVTAAERKIKLVDLISSGRLKPGTLLSGNYRGQHHEAELLPDGTVRLFGVVHNTPSGAGRAFKALRLRGAQQHQAD